MYLINKIYFICKVSLVIKNKFYTSQHELTTAMQYYFYTKRSEGFTLTCANASLNPNIYY